MPILKRTPFAGRITFLGRTRSTEGLLHAEPAGSLTATLAGIEGEVHAGIEVPSCVRMKPVYREKTPIANTRQLSILSEEELAEVAAEMGLDRLDPSLLGATMVVSGIPDFSFVPPGSRLQAEGGATLVVNLMNRPCTIPARAIEAALPGKGKLFKPAAEGKRGLVAWVERAGTLTLGEALTLHIPDQRRWKPEAAVRRG